MSISESALSSFYYCCAISSIHGNCLKLQKQPLFYTQLFTKCLPNHDCLSSSLFSCEVERADLFSPSLLFRKLQRWASKLSPLLPISPCSFCFHRLPIRIFLLIECSRSVETGCGKEGITSPTNGWKSSQPCHPFCLLLSSPQGPGSEGLASLSDCRELRLKEH